jgi:hypothetical protein
MQISLTAWEEEIVIIPRAQNEVKEEDPDEAELATVED